MSPMSHTVGTSKYKSGVRAPVSSPGVTESRPPVLRSITPPDGGHATTPPVVSSPGSTHARCCGIVTECM